MTCLYPKGSANLGECYVHHAISPEKRQIMREKGPQIKQVRAGFFIQDQNRFFKVSNPHQFSIKSAYDMDMRKVIDVYATAQQHIDQGMSLTLFTRSEFLPGMYEWKTDSAYPTKKTTRDLNRFRNYAWTKGIKSLYYVRTFTDDGEIGSVNECASCSI